MRREAHRCPGPYTNQPDSRLQDRDARHALTSYQTSTGRCECRWRRAAKACAEESETPGCRRRCCQARPDENKRHALDALDLFLTITSRTQLTVLLTPSLKPSLATLVI